MSNYYQSNAIYDALKTRKHSFRWIIGNAWLLVYGNKSDSKAKVIVLAHGRSWEVDKEILKVLQKLSNKSGIEVVKVSFDDRENSNVSDIDFSDSLFGSSVKISLSTLKDKLKSYGLDITDGQCDKYLNDSTSSAYHKWQRNSLGNKIIVTDMDLLRVNEQGDTTEIIELKRSYKTVQDWSPYTDDFKNFDLLETISGKINIPFYIVYNQRKSNPFQDIYAYVSIFGYKNKASTTINRGVSFDAFVSGDYMVESLTGYKKAIEIKLDPEDVQIKSKQPICPNCGQGFTPRVLTAKICIQCWKESKGYA